MIVEKSIHSIIMYATCIPLFLLLNGSRYLLVTAQLFRNLNLTYAVIKNCLSSPFLFVRRERFQLKYTGITSLTSRASAYRHVLRTRPNVYLFFRPQNQYCTIYQCILVKLTNGDSLCFNAHIFMFPTDLLLFQALTKPKMHLTSKHLLTQLVLFPLLHFFFCTYIN